MDVQQHSFALQSSHGQRLSLAIISAICLSSIAVWPYLENPVYLTIKYLLIGACVCFFIWQFLRLKTWHCRFVMCSDGTGKLESQGNFVVINKPFITPLAVVFDIQLQNETKRLVIWADMLDDTNYRNLCRLLQLGVQARS
ncbi:hypothetical protein MSG37_02160 [Shewanella sp. 1CM18E]|uniref:protein YgfX n=1 Tax=Shewanella sp. 1CM18E TaxID=2929169 RepID=UPI0020BED95C|nr:hypothetical protein [Shewanella sp. 1CM18E]